jgi:hypothetical protein
MSFSRGKYKSICRKYDADWATLDNVLYDLCERHPDHKSRDAVNAKLWVIGRTYQTGIERKIKSEKHQGSSMEQFAQHIWKHRKQVDGIISRLGRHNGFTPQRIRLILEAHGELLAVVKSMKRLTSTPRSFVSKYLHFHCRDVPIIDSFVQAQLRKLYPWQSSYALFPITRPMDDGYARFVFRFWRFYSEAQETGANIIIKRLDNYLLALARKAK